MGKHTPSDPTKTLSVADTLLDAEKDHYLDCPNAEPTVRASAFLLDVFLFFLASSALHHLTNLAINATVLLPPGSSIRETAFIAQIAIRRIGLFALFYLYFIETVRRFGGTPAKLMLGLRVVDAESGDSAPLTTIVVREALLKPVGGLSFFGLFLPLMRSDRKMVHDLLSNTAVKKIYPDSEKVT